MNIISKDRLRKVKSHFVPKTCKSSIRTFSKNRNNKNLINKYRHFIAAGYTEKIENSAKLDPCFKRMTDWLTKNWPHTRSQSGKYLGRCSLNRYKKPGLTKQNYLPQFETIEQIDAEIDRIRTEQLDIWVQPISQSSDLPLGQLLVSWEACVN